jgi:hypothetical protein
MLFMNMNDDTESLEGLLRGLRPAAPNPELRERVAADLKLDEAWLPRQVRKAPRWVVAAGWAGLGAAAAVAVMGLVMRDFAAIKTSSSQLAEQRAKSNEQSGAGKYWSATEGAWVEVGKDEQGARTKPQEAGEKPKAVLPVNFQ